MAAVSSELEAAEEEKDEDETYEVPEESNEPFSDHEDEQEQVTEDQEEPEADLPQTIDLSSLKPKYNAKSKSSIKHVLTEYGMPDGEGAGNATKTKEVKKKRSHRRDMFTDDDDSRSKTRQQHYLQVYDEVHRLRDYFYEDYMQMLRDKVDKQREEIKKKSERFENKIKKRHGQQKKSTKQQQKHELAHDEDFLSSIPKSDFYKIVGLQDKFTAEGKIKTMSDMDHFWKEIRKPAVFKKYFPPSVSSRYQSQTSTHSHSLESSFKSAPQSQPETKPPPPADFTPMTQIEESRETSRPVTRDEWAVTQQFPPQQKPSSSRLKKPQDPYSIARAAAQELDRQFPMLELPKLSCFNRRLEEEAPDPVVVMQEEAAQRRDKERRLFVKRLRRMYNLSQSNTASTQRILEQHEDDFKMATEGPSLQELLCIRELTSPDLYQAPLALPAPTEAPWMRHLRGRRHSIMPIQEEGETPTLTEEGSSAKTRSGKSSGKTKSQRPSPGPILEPLNLDGIQHSENFVEAKCLSSLWTNYLGVGKSLFAK